MNIEEKFRHISDYIGYRVDIISNDPSRWFKQPYLLPSFEYYMKNCVLDKGGPYDFTKRNYGSTASVKIHEIKVQDVNKEKKVIMTCKHSYWMGTPFNFKEEIHFC